MRARLAAQRRHVRLSDDSIDRAARLYWEAERLGDDSCWLAYRWDGRRAAASARQLSATLAEHRQDGSAIARAPRTRRSF